MDLIVLKIGEFQMVIWLVVEDEHTLFEYNFSFEQLEETDSIAQSIKIFTVFVLADLLEI